MSFKSFHSGWWTPADLDSDSDTKNQQWEYPDADEHQDNEEEHDEEEEEGEYPTSSAFSSESMPTIPITVSTILSSSLPSLTSTSSSLPSTSSISSSIPTTLLTTISPTSTMGTISSTPMGKVSDLPLRELPHGPTTRIGSLEIENKYLIMFIVFMGAAVLIGVVILLAKIKSRLKRQVVNFFNRSSRRRNPFPTSTNNSQQSYLREPPLSIEKPNQLASDYSPAEPQEPFPLDQSQTQGRGPQVVSFLPHTPHHAQNTPQLEEILASTGLHLLEQDRAHRLDRAPRTTTTTTNKPAAATNGSDDDVAAALPPRPRRRFWLVPPRQHPVREEGAVSSRQAEEGRSSGEGSVATGSGVTTTATRSGDDDDGDVVVADAATAQVVRAPSPVMLRSMLSRMVQSQR